MMRMQSAFDQATKPENLDENWGRSVVVKEPCFDASIKIR